MIEHYRDQYQHLNVESTGSATEGDEWVFSDKIEFKGSLFYSKFKDH